jgi:hypothetical protein
MKYIKLFEDFNNSEFQTVSLKNAIYNNENIIMKIL